MLKNLYQKKEIEMTQQTRKSKLSYKKTSHFESSEVDDYMDSIDSDTDEENDEKSYFKTLIEFPEIGISINPSFIQSVEKSFKLSESDYNFEGEPKCLFGIVINKGITQGVNSPKGDFEIWFESEEIRDQRYKKLMTKLDEVGIKIVQIK